MKCFNLFASKPTVARPGRPPAPTAPDPPFAVESYGLSDRGRVRPTNEDRFAVAALARTLRVSHTNLPQDAATDSCHRGHVLVVADGVGGNRAGEVASGLTVRSIEDFLLNTLKRFSDLQADDEELALLDLQAALFRADSRLFEEAAAHPEWRGMGTTLTLAFAVNRRLFVAHAGDSRCYLYSAGRLRQLTRDHTLTADMVRRGLLRPEKQAGHPYRHIVTNLVGGTESGVRVELHRLDLHEEDVVLLCSDGLTEMVPDDRIAAILREERNPRGACERLVASANAAGGEDNITAVVTHIKAPPRTGS